ncbi:hypothetical protein NI370_004464 [Salmonella enterica]|nr:hypothetical protein [Salmonella enterica]EJJ4108606.1 hypothetical protein [Salmonella enterica]EJJ4275850.1 hypothetical protein [Salmonella enterica]EJJ4361430.1 hypothetical protein [Salmonella enterica]EJJ4384024.1 hypothetical protein [Salmonella enterica]
MNRQSKDPIEGLDEDELALLFEVLKALRAERGRAWNTDCDEAEAAHKRPPSLKKYGIDDIRRLARRLGCGKTHWMD